MEQINNRHFLNDNGRELARKDRSLDSGCKLAMGSAQKYNKQLEKDHPAYRKSRSGEFFNQLKFENKTNYSNLRELRRGLCILQS